jgi:hypothetical protein
MRRFVQSNVIIGKHEIQLRGTNRGDPDRREILGSRRHFIAGGSYIVTAVIVEGRKLDKGRGERRREEEEEEEGVESGRQEDL